MWPTWRAWASTVPDGAQAATRQELLTLLAAVVPEDMLSPINTITALPDTDDADVLRFYNAGILTGVDGWGTFAPDKTLTRAETAAMVARVARPELRQTFTPADYDPFTAAGLKPSDVLFTRRHHRRAVPALRAGAHRRPGGRLRRRRDGVQLVQHRGRRGVPGLRQGHRPGPLRRHRRTTAPTCTRTSTCRCTTPACWISGAHKGSPRACARAAVSPLSSRRAAIHGGRPVEARPPAARPRGFPGRWMARRGRRAPRVDTSVAASPQAAAVPPLCPPPRRHSVGRRGAP